EMRACERETACCASTTWHAWSRPSVMMSSSSMTVDGLSAPPCSLRCFTVSLTLIAQYVFALTYRSHVSYSFANSDCSANLRKFSHADLASLSLRSSLKISNRPKWHGAYLLSYLRQRK